MLAAFFTNQRNILVIPYALNHVQPFQYSDRIHLRCVVCVCMGCVVALFSLCMYIVRYYKGKHTFGPETCMWTWHLLGVNWPDASSLTNALYKLATTASSATKVACMARGSREGHTDCTGL